MTQNIKTPAVFNTMPDKSRLLYACTAFGVALLLAAIYHLTEGALVPMFEAYARNLMADPGDHLHGVGGAFLLVTTFCHMLIALSVAKTLARTGPIFEPDDSMFVSFGLQGLTLSQFVVAGMMEGIFASQRFFDNPLSTGGTFGMAVVGAVFLPGLAVLFTYTVRSMWERPHSGLTNMLLYSLFGMLTILTPTMDFMFAVLSLGMVAMGVLLLPLGYKFRCAYDGVTSDWEHRYKHYDPIG